MARKGRQAADNAAAMRSMKLGPGALVAGLLALGLLGVGVWAVVQVFNRPAPIEPPAAAPPANQPHLGQPTWRSQDGDPGIGQPSAPVTILEFSDYQCPNCRQFATEVLPWMAASWMEQGLVRVVFRDFAGLGPESEQAAAAAHCAAEQGRFWAYHDGLFALQSGQNEGAFAPESLQALARQLGLDESVFSACLASGRSQERVRASTDLARRAGYEGTPTFIINGRATSGAIPVARWEELFRLFASDLGFPSSREGTPGRNAP